MQEGDPSCICNWWKREKASLQGWTEPSEIGIEVVNYKCELCCAISFGEISSH
jgi:hypothetical protein